MATPGPLFAAVDVGTTGARASAVDLEGRVVREARHGYATSTPHPGWAEQDPRDWREASLSALAELTQGLERGSTIEAIGLTGQCPTVAPLDGRGEPVGPGLLYRDNRATAQARLMRERFGEEAMHARTGHLAGAFHVGPKVLWLRECEPDVFAAAECFVQPRDVISYALTGVLATDETHANATVLFDLRKREWASELLEDLSLDRSLFPAVSAPSTAVGEVGGGAAARTGLPAGCPVVIGAADSQCAAYGSGVQAPGPISEMAGASSCLNSVVLEPLRDVRITHYSHVVSGCFCTELGLNTTGAAVQWAVEQLGFEDFTVLGAAAGRVRARLLRGGAGADPRLAAPLFLPYLGDGDRDDVTLRAAFIGISDRHGRDELAYAVLEGVAFGVAETVSILAAAGSPVEELRVAGGLARLPELGALKADVLGAPVLHFERDCAPVGAALLAAGHAGYEAQVDDAQRANRARAARWEPDPLSAQLLRARYEWFLDVRGASAVRIVS
jgi:xylulokinase